MDRLRKKSEDFLRATRATVRAISQEPEASACIGDGALPVTDKQVTLGPLSSHPRRADIARLRGEADSFALRLRFHDEDLHATYRPRKDAARLVFDALERCRYEALGARRMAGVATNLSTVIAERHRGLTDTRIGRPEEARLADVVAVLAWQTFSDTELQKPLRDVAQQWRPRLDVAFGERLTEMRETILDQEVFAYVARHLIADLGLEPVDGLSRIYRFANEEAAADHGEEASEGGSATAVKSKNLSATSPQSSEAGQEDTDAGARSGAKPDTLTEGGGEDPGGPTTKRGRPAIGPDSIESFRIAYSTEFDEVVFAEDLCEAEELRALRRELDIACVQAWRSVGRLASRLQHAVMARSPVDWVTCADEGLLDSAQLAAIVAGPVNPLAYKLSKHVSYRDTMITLLVDNSGSMKGKPIVRSAVTADVVAQTLERCGVWVEVLGFTTRAWKGGQTFEQWRRNGMPPNPGRLNDLRHIIYKAAGAPWRRTRRNLGLMLNDDLLKENVDGEAIMWAHQRLMLRPEARRILVVVSDGEPVDNITLEHNADDFLARHLRDVVAWIEARSPVELLAIGIDHEVRRFYPRAIVIEDGDELCEVLLDELTGLFEGRVRPAPPSPEPPKAEEKPAIILPELMMPEDLNRRRSRSSYFY